jgi:predicted MPP superfamily phosphohydrolase
VLRNEGITLRRGTSQLFLAGVDDTWTKRASVSRALSGCPKGTRSVLLAHDPDLFAEAATHGASLVLSGHTHGGQIALPFFARYVSLARIAHRQYLGIYRQGDATLYVHPGLGTTGPPIRLGAAPEVAVLTLRAG